MYQKQYGFRLEGASPLIMHWDNIEWADAMSAERTRIKSDDKANFSAGDDRCPAHTWKGYCYNDGQRIVLPTDNLRSCLLKAGGRIELKGKKTYKELTQCGLLLDEEFLPVRSGGKEINWNSVLQVAGSFAEHADAVKALGFRLSVKRAAIGKPEASPRMRLA